MKAATVVTPADAYSSGDAMKLNHITVCICTFRRPELLGRLLQHLGSQQVEGLFTYSVVVADNDPAQSAKRVVEEFISTAHVPVTYCFEPQQNIARARNRALEHASGNFIAFVDDDEYPESDWLLQLLTTCTTCGVDGVLGPVKPYFEGHPPKWAEKGRFFDRPTYATGYKLHWSQSRTGNVLFKRDILKTVDIPFKTEFDTAGEDIDFFRRMMEKGCTFIWCNEAVVHEIVPASRCNRRYLLKRALLRGSNFPKQRTRRIQNCLKSIVAVPCYALSLPVLLLFGQHIFLRYLIKLFDHASRLLAFAGLKLVTQRET